MVNKLLKYPVFETIFAVLWLYPFENLLNTFLMTISMNVSIFCLVFPSQFTHNYGEVYMENGRAIGITSIFLAYPIFFTIKILILVFIFLLLRKVKLKYAKTEFKNT